MRADDSPAEGVARVEAQTEAAAAAIGDEAARVRQEVVRRILRGDTALDGMAVAVHRFLAADADGRII